MTVRWGIVGLVGLLIVVQAFHHWRLPPWDGAIWIRTDTCSWQIAAIRPDFAPNPLQIGDRLLRIDYKPVCRAAHIPPAKDLQRLYLYEIERKGQKHLLFVESFPPLAVGWPTSVGQKNLVQALHIILAALICWGILLLGEGWQWSGPTFWRESMPLFLGLVFFISSWLFWENPSLPWRPWYLVGVYSLSALWTCWVVGLKRSWVLLPFAGAAALSHLLFPTSVIGNLALALPIWGLSPYAAVGYLLAWGAFWLTPHPLFLPLLGAFWIGQQAPILYRSLRLLPRWNLLVATLAVIAALLVGMELAPLSPVYAVGGSLGSLVLLRGGLSQVIQFFQKRQKRFRLLQESLPQLWEIVDRDQLMAFIQHTLRGYAQVTEVALVEAEDTPKEALPWLRRSGEPFPLSNRLADLPWTPDAALPLPAYGWLLLKEGAKRLTPEDLRRIFPFAAGVSIALRHLKLFEAAHEARLAALRGQLSPHFLFNALNTLQALIPEDPTLAESLMARLSALLRRSLEHARRMTVPLEEEIALAQDYLRIEQERFGTRLHLHWRLPDPLPSVEVPPFSVQLLVENAIKHAVSRLNRPVTLQIAVEETPEALYIRVEDNGPGIELSRLHSSVGLSNLIFRLEQLFGGQATLIAERLTPGTRVTLRFPRRPPSPTAHNHTQARDLS